MKKIEQLVVKVMVLEEMLKTVKPIHEAARKKIKSWVTSVSSHSVEVSDIAKVYLEISKGGTETVPDSAAVLAKFTELVVANQFTQAELVEMVRRGVLAPASGLEAAVATKVPGYVAPTTEHTTQDTAPEHAPMKIRPLSQARYDGVARQVRRGHDLFAEVRRILADPLPAEPRIRAARPARAPGRVPIG